MAQITIYVNGQPYSFNPDNVFAEGGEAYIFKYPGDQVLRYYRQPSDKMFAGTTPEAHLQQRIVGLRLDELQRKLQTLPKGLPPRVVMPAALAWDSNDQARRRIVGTVLPFIKEAVTMRQFSQLAYRRDNGIGYEQLLDAFKDFHATVQQTHAQGAVFGDLNNMNPLVQSGSFNVYVVDSDSMQFGNFECTAFTAKFVDPLICRWIPNPIDGEEGRPDRTGRHSELSDWYAFALMFIEAWLNVPLYGGVYRPRRQQTRIIEHNERPFVKPRLSFFHPDVVYPKRGVVDYSSLPAEILDWYRDLVEKDRREPFPMRFLEQLRVDTDGKAYLVLVVPTAMVPPGQSMVSFGTATSKLIFETDGTIVAMAYHGGRLRFLYHKNGQFFREGPKWAGDGKVVKAPLSMALPNLIRGDATIVTIDAPTGPRTFVVRDDGQSVEPLSVDLFRDSVPTIAANGDYHYYASNGHIYHSPKVDPAASKLVTPKPVEIAETLSGQTRIWAGPGFGFGFYTAANFMKAYVFDYEKAGRNAVDVAPLKGNVIDIRCHFTNDRLWLLTTKREAGLVVNECTLIDSMGNILASMRVPEGHDSWLGSIDSKCAYSFEGKSGKLEALICATADGVVLVHQSSRKFVAKEPFAGTANLVTPGDTLLYCPDGLYVLSEDRKSIRLINTSGK